MKLLCKISLFIFSAVVAGCINHSKCSAAEIMPTKPPYVENYISPQWRKTDKLVTSGIFTYRVIDENLKTIELREINSQDSKIIVPKHIDGYKVVSIGYSGMVGADTIYGAEGIYLDEDINSLRLKGCDTTLVEITIPQGVQYIGACAFKDFKLLQNVNINDDIVAIYGKSFEGCSSLSKINIPSNAAIGNDIFRLCESLKNISLSCQNIRGTDRLFDGSNLDVIHFTGKTDKEYVLNIDDYRFGVNNHIKKVIIDSEIEKVSLNRNVTEVIINGKNTKLTTEKSSEYINECTIKTVKGAKAISFAKRYKINYAVKNVTRIKKVSYNKTKTGRIFKWNKCKTTLVSKTYSGKKWYIKEKNIKTRYVLYGKNKKGNSYTYIGTTGKTKYKTDYNYIKVQPVIAY